MHGEHIQVYIHAWKSYLIHQQCLKLGQVDGYIEGVSNNEIFGEASILSELV
jgi:hypothetical protein